MNGCKPNKAMMIPKNKRWKCRPYLDWVKEQDCVISGAPADDPHHAIGLGMSGAGLKSPDWTAIPMTRLEHRSFHDNYTKAFDNERQWEWIARTLGKAIDEGKLVWKK